ncbi:D-alanine--D-alanine ligase family protein [Bradyrhizobium sp. WSM3983]|uniref:D-alanine--D-alanine ligase family protein n=1 Tax=Bradyrhizobium sp. WSM3983 TaxID=1038867 RepID=UPI00048596C3|nr:D-alanine--D-alanine ligase family protein [Bradyrhizobium sp. WSM3983]
MTILNVALMFGGRSAEYDLSMRSARLIYEALDRKRYNPILVGVSRDGTWRLQENTKNFPSQLDSSGPQIMFLPGGGGKALVDRCSDDNRICHVDVVFPMLPDGVLEGVLETAQVPFVGSRLPAPAICMDKQIIKRILRDAGLPIARSLALRSQEEVKFQFAQEALCSRSVFVKPASFHSSIGISKVTCESEFQPAVNLAFSYGSKVLVEEYVQARELECAILQDAERPSELFCSWPSEIIPTDQHAFFTYQAKIEGKGVIVKTKAELDEAVADRMRALSCEAFRVICCEALARVDFFLRPNGELLINEVTTIPSLNPFSMFSRMMEEAGISYAALLQRLLEGAIKRSERARAGQ